MLATLKVITANSICLIYDCILEPFITVTFNTQSNIAMQLGQACSSIDLVFFIKVARYVIVLVSNFISMFNFFK
jgi:hypothetical protein